MYHPICEGCEKPIKEIEFPDDYANTVLYHHPQCWELKLEKTDDAGKETK